MKIKIIEVVVSPTGETKVETKGFAGTACKEASKFVEQALGQSICEKPTSEFYRTEAQTQQNRTA